MCAVQAGGVVWCWGANGEGEVDGTREAPFLPTPTRVPGLADVVQIAAARHWAAAVRQDGTVWTWGRGGWGMRNGDPAVLVQGGPPTEVSGLSGVRQVALGETHGCALRDDGTVWCWGNDRNGLLGDAARFTATTAAVASTPASPLSGRGPSPGVTPPGVRVHSPAPTDPRQEPAFAPAPVPGIEGAAVVAAFGERTAAVVGGEVWVWGRGAARVSQQWGERGAPAPTADEVAPRRLDGLQDIVQVSLYRDHLVAVDRHGEVWAAGLVRRWEPAPTGAPRTSPVDLDRPERYPDLGGPAVEAAAFEGVAVRLADGTVRVWGAGEVRGDGQPTTTAPSQLSLRATALTAGRGFICILDEDGAIWGWGAGWAGQLGAVEGQSIGASALWYAERPVRISLPPG